MMDCAYPDCESCTYSDCMMSGKDIRSAIKSRREMAGIKCVLCPAYIPQEKEGRGKFYCLVHRKIGKGLHNINTPNFCTAGCEYTDKKIEGIRKIRKILDENSINIDL